MLRPQSNEFRQVISLDGFWDFQPDPSDTGARDKWFSGLPSPAPIAVPASWNDQVADLRDFLGIGWYATRFVLPRSWQGGALHLRFDSVNYIAEAWLNRTRLGAHEGGHLPFSFDVSRHAAPGENLLIVRVDGTLAPDRVPPGNVPRNPLDAFTSSPAWPDSSFDFFPFCGIHRHVRLCLVPGEGITEVRVTTDLAGGKGTVDIALDCGPGSGLTARVRLAGHGLDASVDVEAASGHALATIPVPRPAPWSCAAPNLYQCTITLLRDSTPFDSYSLPVGIRTVSVGAERILLNGEPVYLKGFGRHEDFPVTGRGLVPAVIVRDFDIMRWVGANSFRTSHYPYSEEMMDLADRLGFLVIDETPAVGLFFSGDGLARRAELCAAFTRELIERDRNRPCVIAWSLANEPHSRRPEAEPFLRSLAATARSLDPTRPLTLATYVGADEMSFAWCDFMSFNAYFGWYTESGRIDEGCRRLSAALDALHRRYGKPLLMSEFGADTVAGAHAQPPEMFSEEFQAAFIEAYIDVLRSKPWVTGEHIWNLCDFKTGQAVQRMGGMNLKGVFTRDRRPKMAAHMLRALWNDLTPR